LMHGLSQPTSSAFIIVLWIAGALFYRSMHPASPCPQLSICSWAYNTTVLIGESQRAGRQARQNTMTGNKLMAERVLGIWDIIKMLL
jgi:hypothetical protein